MRAHPMPMPRRVSNTLRAMSVTIFAASHGTSSPEGRRAVQGLIGRVAERLAAPVVSCHVDVEQPDVPSALAAAAPGSRAIIVPLLLSAGYHVYVDLAESAQGSPVPAAVAPALGPDERLVEVLAQRLDEAGWRPEASVVLAAAGSSDARAVVDCRRTGELLAERLGVPVTVGFLSAAEPRLADAVDSVRRAAPRATVFAAPYLLAPGYFLGLVREAGADAVAAPLLMPDDTPPQLVDVVVERADSAARSLGEESVALPRR